MLIRSVIRVERTEKLIPDETQKFYVHSVIAWKEGSTLFYFVILFPNILNVKARRSDS